MTFSEASAISEAIPQANLLPQEVVAKMIALLKPIPRRTAERLKGQAGVLKAIADLEPGERHAANQLRGMSAGDAGRDLRKYVDEVRGYWEMLSQGSRKSLMPSPPWLKILAAVRPSGPGFDPFDTEEIEDASFEAVPEYVEHAMHELMAYRTELEAFYPDAIPGPSGSLVVNAGAPFIHGGLLKIVADLMGHIVPMFAQAGVERLLRGRRVFVFPMDGVLPGGRRGSGIIDTTVGSYYSHIPTHAYVAYGRYVLGTGNIAILFMGTQHSGEMLHTIVHELAHAYWFEVLHEGDRVRFHEFFGRASGHITPYAATKAEEDFAESWTFLFLRQHAPAAFTHDPDAINRFKAFIRNYGRGGLVMPEGVEDDEDAAQAHPAVVKGQQALITRAADDRPKVGQKVPGVVIAKRQGQERRFEMSDSVKVEGRTKFGGRRVSEARTVAARAKLAELRSAGDQARLNELASVANYLVKRALEDPNDADARGLAVQALLANHEPLGSSRLTRILASRERALAHSIEGGDAESVVAGLRHTGFTDITPSGLLGKHLEDNELHKLASKFAEHERGWVKVAAHKTVDPGHDVEIDTSQGTSSGEEEHEVMVFRTPTGHVARVMSAALIAGSPYVLSLHYLQREGF